MRAVARIDAYQRRHRWAGVPLAVLYKFYDDQGIYLAALLTYYGFLSLFPLLLLLVTILGALLRGNPALQQRVLHSALSEFPVIGHQIEQNIGSFHGSGIALAVGVATSLYGALGIAQAAQHTLNKVWGVPRHARPNPFRSRLKGLVFLTVPALGLVVTTLLSAGASAAESFGVRPGNGLRAAAVLVSIAVNALLLLLTQRVLTQRALPLTRMYGAALGGACVWQALQWGGAYYVSHVLRGASATYGFFGIVLGLLAWIYLGALVFVAVAEVSAVRAMRMWPRSLLTPFTDRVRLTAGDRRAYRSYAATECFKGFERIRVDFGGRAATEEDRDRTEDRERGDERGRTEDRDRTDERDRGPGAAGSRGP